MPGGFGMNIDYIGAIFIGVWICVGMVAYHFTR